MKLLTASFFLFLFKFSCCFAQDLSGTWEGNVGGVYLKLVIAKHGNTYVGYTHDIGFGYCTAHFIGEFNDSTQRLKGAGQGFIDKTFAHVLMTYRLKYSERGGDKYLIGPGRPKSIATNILSFGLPEHTQLRWISKEIDTTAYMVNWFKANANRPVLVENNRKTDSIRTVKSAAGDTGSVAIRNTVADTIANKDLLVFDKKAFDDSIRTVKTQRQNEILSRIVTRADSIVITISDNEIVDGDTITIFHNNEILVSRLFVSSKPYRVVIPLTESAPIHEFVLVANNLGSIPPNTALVVIDAGRERYQLKAAADMKKNAVIVFEHRR
ncbi:MAG TPA: hypothetical protein VIM79_12030 [Niastella sp.]